MEHKIDATNKKLGRLATQIATILRGKNSPHFSPEKLSGNKVIVDNASKLDLDPSKLEHDYMTYSGYPGGLKAESRGHLAGRRGWKEVITRTVKRMLPNNKLRDLMLKNLVIND